MTERARAGEAALLLRAVCCVMVAFAASCAVADESVVLAKDELSKYWQAVTGRADAPVELAVEPSVSASGNDAYTIVSTGEGAKITGSNGRSLLYGVYDLLERRGGCGWFWDGDRVPKKEKIDLSGLDVREESKFAYRGIRYFAHRGLTRFQAEHWGFEDWKREIDWCLKKRLNLFMLRIGQDDYFQKAFPDVCAYPDASKPLPGQHDRYDNRSLFWPLEFRGELRKKVMEYAFARGMLAPEDFGTMTHWYSRTPQDFLDKMKPDFLPQAPGAYGEPSGLVWDIRQKKWMDAYWKLTDTGIREYGRPGLLHTIGIAERRISTNRLENLKMKTEWTNMLLSEAKARHPESVRLLAGWDLYCMKTPDEVKNFLKGIPEDVVIWDYEADATINTWFGEWDIVGKRPYVFGIFMAYEAGLDPRTDYAKIAARQKLIENDPMCKGYILWPESSHVDSMGLEWFAKNAWRADAGVVEPVVADYCAKRYPDEATAMRELWMKTIPVSTNMQNVWRWNAFLPILREMNEGLVSTNERGRWPAPKPDTFFADLPEVVATLKELDWEKDPLLRRDMTDLARVWADRLAVEAENRLFTAYFRWLDGDESAAEDVCRNGALAVARLNALAELLALHEDFSICDTYDHLRAIRPVTLPTFASVLVDNVANYYCTSHQAELARHCYIPAFERYLDVLKKKMLANDRTPPEKKCLEAYRKRAMRMDFDKLRLKAPRTREAFNRALDRILASSTPYARELVGRGRPDITNRDGAHWWKERHEAKLKEAAASAESYDLVMIGDSITDFWETRPSNGWEMVTNAWKTLNLGFGGDRVQNVIWRLENGALDNCRAKAVTIMIGTNNHAWKLEASEPEATAAAVERIISLVRERQPEARIVLFGIFPRGTSAKDVRLVEAQRRNVEANKLLRRVATQTAVEWVDLTDRYLDPATGFCRPELFRDGTHPSRAGYEIWFEALKKVVNCGDGASAARRGSSFLPVFSAGMGQDGGKCKFPELPVFRAGIPAYSVNSAMKPNPRPFSKSREYPKKYVRRIEGGERRTTPYRFEEMFADPAATIDSEYARSGKPFFVYERMSRPPYFLPTDGCPLAIRESYETWKKAHPGFIAFNSLWELDSDSNYFERFYDRMGDESIAAELHAAFGPPDAKGRAHRVRWAEKIFRIGADFHFGETTVYPLCSGNPGYEHIFGAMGAKGLWYEATTQSMGPWNTAAAFVRGAARQRGLDYGWYMAHYMTGWTRDGKLVKGHNQRAYGYEGLLKEPHPDRGESRSLFRRKALFGWMIGAKYLMCEAWSHFFIDRKDGRDVPSDSARDFNEIYELSGTMDRGEPFTPLAVLTPLAEPCNVNYQHDKLLDPKTQTDIFNTLVPFLGADGKPSVSRKAGDQGCLFNSEFANAFDVLCPDSGQDSAAFAKALSRYRHVLIAGEAFDKAKFDTAALAAFEKAGGKVHRYPSPGCDTPEKLRALLLSIQDETLPVKVEGDIQWGVNFVEGKREEGRGKRGRYLVYLINNKGVIKYCDAPEEFDETKVAHVTVTVKATGETFVRDVKPGDFCLLTLGGE